MRGLERRRCGRALVSLALVSVLLPRAAAFAACGSSVLWRPHIRARSLNLRLAGGGSVAMSTGCVHPAVEGWPDKYAGKADGGAGPKALHTAFAVEKATEEQLAELDVKNWPTWSTRDNEKWVEGKTNADKVMPYNELSYVLSGKLEIIPPSGTPVLVQAGDFVTFPEGFKSTWTVLEELTWHYYLY